MSETASATVPADINQQVIGYIMNSGLSEPARAHVADLQERIAERFPGSLWAAPGETLHITLLDWLAPLVDYGEDKDAIFQRIREEYSQAIIDILSGQPPIPIAFDTLEAHPTAIIIKGHDDGSYQRIRDAFLERIDLLPGTKPPPQIIHATICKFTAALPLADVQAAARELGSIAFQEETTAFRLVREEVVYMRKAETIAEFPLYKTRNA